MKTPILFASLWRSFPVALPLVAVLGATGTGTLHAQTFYKPTGILYESSQNKGGANAAGNTTGNRAGTYLFDDATPTFGKAEASATTGSTVGFFFAGIGGTGNDANPIVAFDLGSTVTVNAAGYSQNLLGVATADKVGTINVYTLTLAQYNAYTPKLVTANPNATASLGAPQAAPTAGNYVSMGTLTVTDAADSVYTQYNFPTALTGEYYVVQFNALTGSGGFPGGQEFELAAVSVPEPGTYAGICFAVVALGLARRRQLTALFRGI